MKNPSRIIRVIIVAVFSFGINPAWAQVRITGKVEQAAGMPLQGVNVLLLSQVDSLLQKGTLTTASGNFQFDGIAPGNYILSLNYSGYKPVFSPPLAVQQEDRHMGSFKLVKEEKDLAAVTVVSRKPLFEQKVDRMVVNVKNSITSAGGTALEVLEKSPGVLVNHQSNSIALSGKEGVRLMINGKLTQMPMDAVLRMLSGMNASNIDRIELITTPPANFDAEGNAGFINIILLANPNNGLNGSYSVTAGYGEGYTPAGAISFNYRNNKVNLFGDYSFTWNNQTQPWHFAHRYTIQGVPFENLTETMRSPKDGQQNARLGVDIQLTPKTVLGFLTGGYNTRWDMDASNMLTVYKGGVADSLVSISNREVNRWIHYMGNVNFSHTFGEGHTLSADVDYLYYKDDNPNTYHNSYFGGSGTQSREEYTRSSKLTPLSFWVGKADYSRKLHKRVSMEAGAKLAFSEFENDVVVETLLQNSWKKDSSLTAKYFLKERIAAAYASFQVEAGARTSLKFGLRYEYSTSNLNSEVQRDIVNRKYGRLFPTIFISRKLNDKQSVNLSYSRRITRPTFKDMAPFVIFMDPFTFFSGNSGLQPAFSDIYKADYLLGNHVFSVSYTKETSSIANFQPKNSADNKVIIAAENLDNIQTINLSITLPFTISKWWNMQNNMQGNWQQISAIYNKGPFRITQWNMSLNSTQTFTLNKGYSMELSGFYNSKSLFGTSVVKPFGMANFGVQKKFADSRNKLRFGIDDIFNSAVFRVSTDIPAENLYSSARLRFGYRTYKLTFTHNFGKSIRDKRQRSTASEEEQGRVK